MADASHDAKEIARLDAEVARLRTLAYVPGLFKCAKCSCSVMSTSMHVTTGQFAANTEPQSCPNGCGPMWPVTERDAGNEAIDRADVLRAQLDATRSATCADCVGHVELNGHIDIAEQVRDYLAHEAMDHGDPSGKLHDFVASLRIVIDQLDRQRRRANWYEVAYDAGKTKLIDGAVEKALNAVRDAARAYASAVNDLGGAADDNDPRVMACAEPIGAAQAALWIALGIYNDDELSRLQAEDDKRIAELRAPSKVCCEGEPHTCDQELVAAAEGRTDRVIIERNLLVANVAALTEDLAKYRAEVARMRPVYEAAIEWNAAEKAVAELPDAVDNWTCGAIAARQRETRAINGLRDAIDAALATEPLVATDATPVDDIRRARVVVSPTGEVLKNAYGRIAEPKPTPVCSTCNDTHSMNSSGAPVMCTRCPLPCQSCRSGGNGPYCEKTPCGCACHAAAEPKEPSRG